MKSFLFVMLVVVIEIIATALMSYPLVRKMNNDNTSVVFRNTLGIIWFIAFSAIIAIGRYIVNPQDFNF